MAAPSEHFPAIGKVVEETAKQNERGAGQGSSGEADEERAVQEVESLCMKCFQQVCSPIGGRSTFPLIASAQGVTRLLLTSIPFFREVIIMSFRCEHCGFQNNEIQSAGMIRRE